MPHDFIRKVDQSTPVEVKVHNEHLGTRQVTINQGFTNPPEGREIVYLGDATSCHPDDVDVKPPEHVFESVKLPDGRTAVPLWGSPPEQYETLDTMSGHKIILRRFPYVIE